MQNLVVENSGSRFISYLSAVGLPLTWPAK